MIDRIDKLPKPEWERQASELGMDQITINRLEDLLNNQDLWKESEELTSIFKYLEAYGISDYVKYDPRVIRGLDYYTGVVFEAWDVGGDGRAILGGGHYDNLVGDVGGNPLPGVGFAMGDVMFGLMLEKYGCIPDEVEKSKAILVTCFDQDLFAESLLVATDFRAKGLEVVVYPEAAKLQKQFKFADRETIRFVVVIGPDEVKARMVTIKDLKDGTQQTIKASIAAETIIEKLAFN